MKKIQKIGLALTIIILIVTFLIPPTETLSLAARNMLGLLLAVIVLLVTEVFPLGITCLAAISGMVLLGCAESVPVALSGFTNATVFFVVASFGVSTALTIVPLSKRLLLALMTKFGKNIQLLLLAIMMCTALLSSIISNVAAAAIFIPIINSFLEVYETEEARKRTARCYMIALPIASMIGGMMTPAGSSINMIAISLLQKNAGITVPFVTWMLFGIPISIVILPFAWWVCCKVFRPAPLDASKIRGYIDSVEIDKKMSFKEKYVLTIVIVMLVLWILSSWFPVFNITVVALLGIMLFFIPVDKVRIMTWRQFVDGVSWEAFILMAVMISMGNCISSTGLSQWISQVVFPASFSMPYFVIIAFVCILTFVLLIPIPVAPALVTMISIPLIDFSTRIGASPYLLNIALGLCAVNCYFLPLDTVPLMTFSTGAYKMFDMPKVSVWIQLALVVVVTVWLSIVGKLLGI